MGIRTRRLVVVALVIATVAAAAITSMVFDISTNLVNNANATNANTTTNDSHKEIITSKGCAEGLGYHVNDPNPRCYPLDAIGEEPPEGTMYCAALGCPWNPPDLSK